MNRIGLRKEEKAFETRVPIIPEHITLLNEKHDIQFVVEPSDQRAFDASEYKKVGSEVSELKGSGVPIILGIKEMPINFFEKGVVYLFFSHTIKGQKYNMPMLQRIIDVGATLIDYERVVDDKGRRTIFFGNWAGMAGVSDTFRILGERLESEGITPNPFANMKPTMKCKNLAELKNEFQLLGQRISNNGIPKSMTPFVVGFAGYGNVSRGAQQLFDLLPFKAVKPDDLPNLKPETNFLYKCVFKEEHMVEPIDPDISFELQDYYDYGSSKYRGVFEKYVPYLTVLMNCIYWSSKYPRLVTKDFIRQHWNEKNRRLVIVGDISCDVEGAIEFTIKCTNPGNPSFTYLVEKDKSLDGITGNGPVVMSVDNLPCELPRESSKSFSETLLDYIPPLAQADFTVSFDDLELPKEIKDAVIVYQGKLTKDYQYLKQYLQTKES